MYHVLCNDLGLLRQPDMKKNYLFGILSYLEESKEPEKKLIRHVKETLFF